jgi:PhnB protein
MPKRSLADQLDQAVAALLARPGAEVPRVEARLAPLLRLAGDLRDLPRENFKARLKSDLEGRSSMTTNLVEPAAGAIPGGLRTVTPYLVVAEAGALIDFVKQVFGAEETLRGIGSAGGIHANVRLGDSMLMIGGGGPGLSWRGTSWPAALHVYVEDVEAAYQRALAAGGVEIHPPADQEYGEREGGVKDPFGNHWYIARAKGERHIPEGLRTVNSFLHPLRAEPVISFLKRAFGAVEVAKYASPDGVVHHAKIRMGDTIVEMSEAHGPCQPMPSMFFLYVPNVDASYRRALEAGAISTGEPADQPYGDRTAGVKDVFGNQWYLATHLRDREA